MNFLALSLVFFDCLLATSLVNALSSPTPEIMPRQFIQLTNPVGAEQSLPASFVRNWPTWVLDEDGTLSKIPDEDGFVQPASIDELWQPLDLKMPELRLALGLHVCVINNGWSGKVEVVNPFLIIFSLLTIPDVEAPFVMLCLRST
jgi:hypothetical protein